MNWRRLLMMTCLSVPLAFSASFELGSGVARAQAQQDYCRYGERTILILVDRTTAYDDLDKKLFVDGFERIIQRLRIGDAVVVHTIQDSYVDSTRVFSECLPGCPEEGLMNWLLGTCKALVARGDLARFRAGLAKSIRQLLDNPQSYKHSDIVRTVAAVTNAYAARAANDKGSNLALLLLFSDLLENSEIIPWHVLRNGGIQRALKIAGSSGVRPSLNGVEVAAFGFGRSHDRTRRPLPPEQERRVREFWTNYLQAGGASNIYIGQYLN